TDKAARRCIIRAVHIEIERVTARRIPTTVLGVSVLLHRQAVEADLRRKDSTAGGENHACGHADGAEQRIALAIRRPRYAAHADRALAVELANTGRNLRIQK